MKKGSDLVLRLGTRRSPLALAQSRQVAAALEERHPGVRVELVPIVTRGDKLPGDLSKLGGKGLFTEELEAGLLDGSLDLAVHSLKDLPVALPEGLIVAAHPPRADPRDALICETASRLDALPRGAVLLTGSTRRRAQLLHLRDDLRVEPIRGNVGTRLRKWRESGHAGVILAAAGLARLGLDDVPVHPIDPRVVIPAPGQGILAVEVRRGGRAEAYCRALDDPTAARAARAERRIVEAFGGDCTLPLAAWARDEDGHLVCRAMLATPDGERLARGEGAGPDPLAAAEACLDAMRRDGAGDVLRALRGDGAGKLPPEPGSDGAGEVSPDPRSDGAGQISPEPGSDGAGEVSPDPRSDGAGEVSREPRNDGADRVPRGTRS